MVNTTWGPREISRSVGEHDYTFTFGFMVVRTIVKDGIINQLIPFGGTTLYGWWVVSTYPSEKDDCVTLRSCKILTMWGPLVISWFIIPSNHGYNYTINPS